MQSYANAIQKQHEDNASQRGPKMVEVSGEMAIAALQKLEASFGFRIYRKANVSIGRHQQLGLPSNLYIAWQGQERLKGFFQETFSL